MLRSPPFFVKAARTCSFVCRAALAIDSISASTSSFETVIFSASAIFSISIVARTSSSACDFNSSRALSQLICSFRGSMPRCIIWRATSCKRWFVCCSARLCGTSNLCSSTNFLTSSPRRWCSDSAFARSSRSSRIFVRNVSSVSISPPRLFAHSSSSSGSSFCLTAVISVTYCTVLPARPGEEKSDGYSTTNVRVSSGLTPVRLSVNSCCTPGPPITTSTSSTLISSASGGSSTNFPRALMVTVSPSCEARSSTGCNDADESRRPSITRSTSASVIGRIRRVVSSPLYSLRSISGRTSMPTLTVRGSSPRRSSASLLSIWTSGSPIAESECSMMALLTASGSSSRKTSLRISLL